MLDQIPTKSFISFLKGLALETKLRTTRLGLLSSLSWSMIRPTLLWRQDLLQETLVLQLVAGSWLCFLSLSRGSTETLLKRCSEAPTNWISNARDSEENEVLYPVQPLALHLVHIYSRRSFDYCYHLSRHCERGLSALFYLQTSL